MVRSSLIAASHNYQSNFPPHERARELVVRREDRAAGDIDVKLPSLEQQSLHRDLEVVEGRPRSDQATVEEARAADLEAFQPARLEHGDHAGHQAAAQRVGRGRPLGLIELADERADVHAPDPDRHRP